VCPVSCGKSNPINAECGGALHHGSKASRPHHAFHARAVSVAQPALASCPTTNDLIQAQARVPRAPGTRACKPVSLRSPVIIRYPLSGWRHFHLLSENVRRQRRSSIAIKQRNEWMNEWLSATTTHDNDASFYAHADVFRLWTACAEQPFIQCCTCQSSGVSG